MKDNINIRSRDKINGFISVIVVFSLCASCILYALLHDSDMTFVQYKDVVEKKTERQAGFRKVQSDMIRECDSLYSRINRFDPSVNAVYEENDIKFLINELRLTYEHNMWDKRYKVFFHMSLFYEMWFADKKTAWSKGKNITAFSQNLEKCEIGLDDINNQLK